MEKKGRLYLCPTPLGNLEDITLRTLRTLECVDIVAAEDTRHSLRLLNHFEIKKPLTSYHEHNKIEKGPVLIDELIRGKDIALVTDAGMPAVSDPGEDLVRLCIEASVEVIALPGPTAFVLALVLSGFSTRRFVYEGFLSQKKSERRTELEKFKKEPRTVIFYESPHRLRDCLKDIRDVLGERELSISRELTKKYEEVFRGTVDSCIEKFSSEAPRGEFVLVLKGVSLRDLEDAENEKWKNLTIREHLKEEMRRGLDKKEAIKSVSKAREIRKNEVYQEAIDIK